MRTESKCLMSHDREMATTLKPACVPVSQNERYERLQSAFETKYGISPAFFARAPGRVNLIGEHIDYCGYDVLPMAIEQDIVIACALADSATIELANLDPQYSSYTGGTSLSDVVVDRQAPQWFHYFLCGYKGALEDAGMSASVGLRLLLDGSVPRSAGLSSSSALVCCACLVTLHANSKTLDKHHLAEVCQHCERYIGTEGGGMDQAISFLAEPGTAKLIEFKPLKTTDVKLQEGAVFVVSNSCVELNKAATSHYNTRVAECRLAMQVMAKSKGLPWQELSNLRDLQSRLGVDTDHMMELVKSVLHEEAYTREELCKVLEVTDEELQAISLSERTKHLEQFKLRDRALHVYSEAGRVWKFRAVCEESGGADTLVQLGQLMTQSHHSCRDQYECSCPELDTLVDICMSSGAVGSRLTGAGWGGCAVSLVPASKLDTFLSQVASLYYSSRAAGKSQASLSASLFATKPGGGAAIYTD